MKPAKRATKVVVVTSVMLSFISFWRAAAIVHTAAQLNSAEVIEGPSPVLPPKGKRSVSEKRGRSCEINPCIRPVSVSSTLTVTRTISVFEQI